MDSSRPDSETPPSPRDDFITVRRDDGSGTMFFSAVIFGFFSFMIVPIVLTSTVQGPGYGKPIAFFELFRWTLPASGVLFLISAIVTRFVAIRVGHWIYAISGLLSAILMGVAAYMDWRDPNHAIPIMFGATLVAVFAVWNGYGSVQSVRLLLASARRHPAHPGV